MEKAKEKKSKVKIIGKARYEQHVLYRSNKEIISAILGFMCYRCWKTTTEIEDCVNGELCEVENTRWARMNIAS